ncbi:MAG TPA: sensor domain-containing diguanylate cyclase [Methylovirgula sp.]|nr:sensor domain-containing diguanylate cyclase [Methylovirgula sp.]
MDPVQEDERLSALDRYDILDTPPEEAFDRITNMTRKIFRMPMAAINFIDGHRHWLKSKQGLTIKEGKRRDAICNVAIEQDEPLVIEDTKEDARLCSNPYVLDDPHLRFYAGAPLLTRDGHKVGVLCVMDTKPHKFGPEQTAILADLAKAVMTELDLRLLASTDPLTGALSRRAFKDEAERAKLLAVRHGHALSCMIFDLDHFKDINDRYGHSVGDFVLRGAVEACRASLRKSDVLGRIGGEEFAVILPHTAAAPATRVAEKARRAIAKVSVARPEGRVKVSASFGVAELDRGAADVDELLRRADEALYAAKEAGRNQCAEWRASGATRPNVMQKVFKAGQIAFNAGNSVIDCTVRGLSDAGACLDVISSAGVPDRFKLRINSDNLSRFCSVVSKRDTRLEVAFM